MAEKDLGSPKFNMTQKRYRNLKESDARTPSLGRSSGLRLSLHCVATIAIVGTVSSCATLEMPLTVQRHLLVQRSPIILHSSAAGQPMSGLSHWLLMWHSSA